MVDGEGESNNLIPILIRAFHGQMQKWHHYFASGGPCSYTVREGSGISNDWILENVVPQIASHFPGAVVLVLGCALLWLVFEDYRIQDGELYLPNDMIDQVWLAYQEIPGRTLPLIENPIKKMQLVGTGDEGEVYIDELGGDEENEDGSDNIGRRMR